MMSGNERHGSMDLPRNDSKRSIILYFNNCGIFELLSSLQVNTLLCYHTFIDAGRRHGSPGWETKDIISLFQTTQKTVDQSPQPPVSKLKQSWAQVDVAHNGLVSRLRVLSLENHNLKKKKWLQICLHFSRKETLSLLSWSVNKPVSNCEGGHHFYLPRLFAIQTFLEFSPGPKLIHVQICNRELSPY